jgi:WD40 repeat protein
MPLIVPENMAALQQVAIIPNEDPFDIYKLAISPLGTYVAYLAQNLQDRSTVFFVWSLKTGTQILKVEIDPASGLFYLPDETQVLVISRDRIRSYDLASGELVNDMAVPLLSGALSSDGSLLAVGVSEENDTSTITLYDFDTGKEIAALNDLGQVRFVEFSPDGKQILAGLGVGTTYWLKVWDVSSLKLMKELRNYSSPVFTLDGSLAVSRHGDHIILLDTQGWRARNSYTFERGNFYPQSFSKDGRIFIGSNGYSTVFWEVETGEVIYSMPDYGYARFSPAGDLILSWVYTRELTNRSLVVWGVKP